MATKNTTSTTPTVEELQNVSYVDIITQTGDAVLNAIAESQELFLRAAKTVVESLPKAPEFVSAPIPGAPEVNVPSTRELIETGFAFADKYLANQKAYTEKYLALTGA
jgi:hypothetical protein